MAEDVRLLPNVFSLSDLRGNLFDIRPRAGLESRAMSVKMNLTNYREEVGIAIIQSLLTHDLWLM